MMGKSGIPAPRADAFAKEMKKVVAKLTLGLPRFSIATASWIHHAVQPPHCPNPTITTSHFRANSS